jgi:hypothetical protein
VSSNLAGCAIHLAISWGSHLGTTWVPDVIFPVWPGADRTGRVLILEGVGMPPSASAQIASNRAALYASVGPKLTYYDIDRGDKTMFWMGMVPL